MDELIRDLAEVLAGCQVPMNIGVLGEARAPLIRLRQQLHLFGYPDVEEHERRLRETLIEAMQRDRRIGMQDPEAAS